MTTNSYNANIVAGLLDVIDRFGAGWCEIADVQVALQNATSLFENDSSGVAGIARLAEADLEEILFTNVLVEQRPAALMRLEELRQAINGL